MIPFNCAILGCNFLVLFFLNYLFTIIFITLNTSAMKTKLTLVMDDEVIYNAKIYAKKKEESLSSLVENYLKAVAVDTKDEKNKTKKLHPKIAQLKGVINLPKNFNYKNELGKILLERYNKLK